MNWVTWILGDRVLNVDVRGAFTLCRECRADLNVARDDRWIVEVLMAGGDEPWLSLHHAGCPSKSALR